MKTLLTEKQYKVNMHAHSTVSDGNLSPEEIKAQYMAAGYHAVAFTDHEVLVTHNDLTDDAFVALNGYEYAVMREKGGPCYHMNLICKTQAPHAQVMFAPDSVKGNARHYVPSVSFVGDFVTPEYAVSFINRLTESAHRNGYLVQYNHPIWSLQSYPDYAELAGIDLLEVINCGDTRGALADRDDRVFRDMLMLGKFPMITGGDDNHNEDSLDSPYSDAFRGFTMLCAERLTYEDLITALEKGCGYASEGPIIRSLAAHDGMLYGEVSSARLVRLQGAGRKGSTLRATSAHAPITRFAIPFDEAFGYLRLTVEDFDGRHAYTRAYRISELS